MIDTARNICLVNFLHRLAETIDWCKERASVSDPKNCLRTARLSPDALAGSRFDVVESVCCSRHAALKWPAKRIANELYGGRLLAYSPDDDLSDCAAEVETNGYFDCRNVPPWDSWVGYIYESKKCNYLVSWVAPCFIESVSRGIYVNPEECIWWMDEKQTEFSAMLKEVDLQ